MIQKALIPQNTQEAELYVSQLSKNYELLRHHTKQGFVISCVFMALGVIVILSGSVGKIFGFASVDSDLTSIAGIITEFISATALWLYRANFKRLGETSDRLDNSLNILVAFRETESLPDYERNKTKVELIRSMMERNL